MVGVDIKTGAEIAEEIAAALPLKHGVSLSVVNWVKLTPDVKKALALFAHLMNHKELVGKEAMCKICNTLVTDTGEFDLLKRFD